MSSDSRPATSILEVESHGHERVLRRVSAGEAATLRTFAAILRKREPEFRGR